MSKIRICLWAFAFFSIALSAATAAEQTLEKREPPTTKDEALSRLMEDLLRGKSPLPLNTPSTPTAAEATAEKAEHQNLEANTSRSQASQSPLKESTVKEAEHQNLKADNPPSQDSQSPPAIAVGVIIRFKSPEIQALSRDNLPPPPEVIAELEAALGEKLIFQGAIGNGTYAFHFLTPKEGEEVISSLLQSARGLPSIEWIEADRRVQVQSSSAPVQSSLIEAQSSAYFPDLFNYQWNLMGKPEGIFGGIDAIGAWEITHGSSDTVVAVVDSGIVSHPEFSGRVLPGYNFADGPDGNGSDPGYNNDCGGAHSSWHGTHVAGIIAASGDDGSGIAGINWKTRILPVRVSKCGRANEGDIIKGIKWAAGLAVGSSIPGVNLVNPYPAQLINLSIAGMKEEACPASYQEAINKIIERGVLIVVAAGNNEIPGASPNTRAYPPANCVGVLRVVATDHTGEFASYTMLDYSPDDIDITIAAPGGDINQYGDEYGILSTVDKGAGKSEAPPSPGDDWHDWYKWKQGTSMAAPHVSGIASLMLGVNPQLSGLELFFLLKYASNPFPAGSVCAAYGVCGVGIADAYRSVIIASYFKDYQFVYEFHNTGTDHYMLTGSKKDAAALYRGGEGLENWKDTFKYFYAWSGPIEGAVPVYRFYTLGANSHFYTAKPEEYDLLIKDNKDNVYAYDKWTYENIAFYAKLPTNGVCPADTRAIYRLYNGHAEQNDSNHRFVSSRKDYVDMMSKGWLGENVVFCVVAATGDD